MADPQPGDCDFIDANGDLELLACSAGPTGNSTVLAAGTPIMIALAPSAQYEKYACDTYLGDGEWPDFQAGTASGCTSTTYVAGCDCSGTDCPLDLPPAGMSVTCSADKTSYVYKTRPDDAALCGTTVCHFGTGAVLPGQTPPANWPCLVVVFSVVFSVERAGRRSRPRASLLAGETHENKCTLSRSSSAHALVRHFGPSSCARRRLYAALDELLPARTGEIATTRVVGHLVRVWTHGDIREFADAGGKACSRRSGVAPQRRASARAARHALRRVSRRSS